MFHQILSALTILLPLVIGFLVPLRTKIMQRVSSLIINFLVYAILIIMGIGLAHLDNLGKDILRIFGYALVFIAFLAGINILLVGLWDRISPWKEYEPKQVSQSFVSKIFISLKQLGLVGFGIVLGLFIPKGIFNHDKLVFWLLVSLLFLIGSQLRSSGISLTKVFLNKRGMKLVLWFLASCYIASIMIKLTLGIPLSKAMALCSGYGWYSLSGSVMTSAYDPFWGGVALLNDLGRELLALMFIPVLMQRHPSAAVSLGGATSLDFCLPTIIKSGGNNAMLMAISFSFIVNIISPIAMLMFSSFNF